MPPKLRYPLMDRDDLAWDRGDKVSDEWARSIGKAEIFRAITNLILKHRPGDAEELHIPIWGGYNVFYRLEYKDGSSVGMRIPIKGVVMFPEEKVRYEVATMRYVAANTTIPVPKVYYCGPAAENPAQSGPFIIMDYIEHKCTMSEALNDPALDPDASHALNPNINEERLQVFYKQMANIVLQLSNLIFPRIGSLEENKDDHIAVTGRPLIQNMSSMVEFSTVSPTLLPSRPFQTSKEWYSALADMHLAQLTFQQNDAVEDEDDARDKYVARQLFRQLASNGRLGSELGIEENDDNEPMFRIYSEDLRPSNVLIDENDHVVAVIDWEFAYAAPSQFSYDPPWWLLLKGPEFWPGVYKAWMEACEPRFNTFIRLLEAEEKSMLASSMANLTISKSQGLSLSQRMRKSWDNKTWMINLAARNSWAFDAIYWRFLDPRFLGPNEEGDYKARLELLTQEQREAMEPFVKMKMEQKKERVLVEHDEDYIKTQWAKVFI